MKNSLLVLLSFSMVFFSCCCDDCEDDDYVTYKVHGAAASASVMFHNDYGDAEQFNPVKLPWEYSFTIKERGKDRYGGEYNGYFPAFISARSLVSSSTLTVTIYVGGKPVASETSTETKPTAEVSFCVEL